MREIKEKTCPCCKVRFRPNVRLMERQRTCGSEACRKKHRAMYQRKYRQQNKIEEIEYRDKRNRIRDPTYWQKWREKHPAYVARNRKQTNIRIKMRRECLQRKLDIEQLIENKRYFEPFIMFAKKHRCLFSDEENKTMDRQSSP